MKVLLLVPFILITLVLEAQKNGFSQIALKSVVELQVIDKGKIETHGTGFLLLDYKDSSSVIIVTNSHLLKRGYIILRIPATDTAKYFMSSNNLKKLNTFSNSNWQFDTLSFSRYIEFKKDSNMIEDISKDIAVIRVSKLDIMISTNGFSRKMVDFFKIGKDDIGSLKTTEVGDKAFFIGFPFGIGGKNGYYASGIWAGKKLNPLVRTASVALVDDTNYEFLLDGFSYSGNSGSPVFSAADYDNGMKLIGIVAGHLKNPFVVDDKVDINHGLVRCVWIDNVLELIKKLK